jgi:hypothetical protein
MNSKELYTELNNLEKVIKERFTELLKGGKEYNFITPLLPDDFESDDLEETFIELVQNGNDLDLPLITLVHSFTGNTSEYRIISIDENGMAGVMEGRMNIEYGLSFLDILSQYEKIYIIAQMEEL